MSSFGYTNGAYNAAAGTRDAFGALSDDLVREGFPPMVSRSGDREYADQLRIWHERMVLKAEVRGRKVYGTKKWQGKTWYRIHPDTVAVPTNPPTSNHGKRRSNDLTSPYNDRSSKAHKRAQQLAPRHNITWEGENFDEDWHWTFWGPLGTIGAADAPSTGGTLPAPLIPESEEDEMDIIRWNKKHVFALGRESILHVTDKTWVPYIEDHYGIRDVDDGALTLELEIHGIHWDAVDAVLRGGAFGTIGRYWSRLTAEGLAIRGTQTAQSKTLADVLATAKKITV